MQATAKMEYEGEEMIVKSLSVPIGLEELMESLTKEVLIKKPTDVYSFAYNHFRRLLGLRDRGYRAQPPLRGVKTVIKRTTETKNMIPPKTNASARRQLSKQASINVDASDSLYLTGSNKKLIAKKEQHLNNNNSSYKNSKATITEKRKFRKTVSLDNQNRKQDDERFSRNDANKRETVKSVRIRTKSEDIPEKKDETIDRRRISRNYSVQENVLGTNGKLLIGSPKIIKRTQTPDRISSTRIAQESKERKTDQEKDYKQPKKSLKTLLDEEPLIIKKESGENTDRVNVKSRSESEEEILKKEERKRVVAKSLSAEATDVLIKDGKLVAQRPKIVKRTETLPGNLVVPTTKNIMTIEKEIEKDNTNAVLNNKENSEDATKTLEKEDVNEKDLTTDNTKVDESIINVATSTTDSTGETVKDKTSFKSISFAEDSEQQLEDKSGSEGNYAISAKENSIENVQEIDEKEYEKGIIIAKEQTREDEHLVKVEIDENSAGASTYDGKKNTETNEANEKVKLSETNASNEYNTNTDQELAKEKKATSKNGTGITEKKLEDDKTIDVSNDKTQIERIDRSFTKTETNKPGAATKIDNYNSVLSNGDVSKTEHARDKTNDGMHDKTEYFEENSKKKLENEVETKNVINVINNTETKTNELGNNTESIDNFHNREDGRNSKSEREMSNSETTETSEESVVTVEERSLEKDTDNVKLQPYEEKEYTSETRVNEHTLNGEEYIVPDNEILKDSIHILDKEISDNSKQETFIAKEEVEAAKNNKEHLDNADLKIEAAKINGEETVKNESKKALTEIVLAKVEVDAQETSNENIDANNMHKENDGVKEKTMNDLKMEQHKKINKDIQVSADEEDKPLLELSESIEENIAEKTGDAEKAVSKECKVDKDIVNLDSSSDVCNLEGNKDNDFSSIGQTKHEINEELDSTEEKGRNIICGVESLNLKAMETIQQQKNSIISKEKLERINDEVELVSTSEGVDGTQLETIKELQINQTDVNVSSKEAVLPTNADDFLIVENYKTGNLDAEHIVPAEVNIQNNTLTIIEKQKPDLKSNSYTGEGTKGLENRVDKVMKDEEKKNDAQSLVNLENQVQKTGTIDENSTSKIKIEDIHADIKNEEVKLELSEKDSNAKVAKNSSENTSLTEKEKASDESVLELEQIKSKTKRNTEVLQRYNSTTSFKNISENTISQEDKSDTKSLQEKEIKLDIQESDIVVKNEETKEDVLENEKIKGTADNVAVVDNDQQYSEGADATGKSHIIEDDEVNVDNTNIDVAKEGESATSISQPESKLNENENQNIKNVITEMLTKERRGYEVQTAKNLEVGNEINSSKYDPAKLKQELEEVQEATKYNTFKTNYNPYVLRNEIRNASNEKAEDSRSVIGFADKVGAVVKIQAFWRRHLTRNVAEAIRKNKQVSLENIEEKNKRKSPAFGDKVLAVVKIQALWRGYMARKIVKNIMKNLKHSSISIDKERTTKLADVAAVVKIQARWRGYKVRKEIKAMKMNGKDNKQPENELAKKVAAVLKIQSLWRSYKMRSVKIMKQKKNGQEGRSVLERKVAAVIRIQSLWRGFVARRNARNTRKNLKSALAKKLAAVLKIQSLWRGYRARKLLKVSKEDAFVIHTYQSPQYKTPEEETIPENALKKQVEAVLLLQRVWRGFKVRKTTSFKRKSPKDYLKRSNEIGGDNFANKEKQTNTFKKIAAATIIQSFWRRYKSPKNETKAAKELDAETEAQNVNNAMEVNTVGEDKDNVLVNAGKNQSTLREESAKSVGTVKDDTEAELTQESMENKLEKGDATESIVTKKLSDEEIQNALQVLDEVPVPTHSPTNQRKKRNIENPAMVRSATVDEPEMLKKNAYQLTRSHSTGSYSSKTDVMNNLKETIKKLEINNNISEEAEQEEITKDADLQLTDNKLENKEAAAECAEIVHKEETQTQLENDVKDLALAISQTDSANGKTFINRNIENVLQNKEIDINKAYDSKFDVADNLNKLPSNAYDISKLHSEIEEMSKEFKKDDREADLSTKNTDTPVLTISTKLEEDKDTVRSNLVLADDKELTNQIVTAPVDDPKLLEPNSLNNGNVDRKVHFKRSVDVIEELEEEDPNAVAVHQAINEFITHEQLAAVPQSGITLNSTKVENDENTSGQTRENATEEPLESSKEVQKSGSVDSDIPVKDDVEGNIETEEENVSSNRVYENAPTRPVTSDSILSFKQTEGVDENSKNASYKNLSRPLSIDSTTSTDSVITVISNTSSPIKSTSATKALEKGIISSALEDSLKSVEDRNVAATKIQTTYRGHLTRKNLKNGRIEENIQASSDSLEEKHELQETSETKLLHSSEMHDSLLMTNTKWMDDGKDEQVAFAEDNKEHVAAAVSPHHSDGDVQDSALSVDVDPNQAQAGAPLLTSRRPQPTASDAGDAAHVRNKDASAGRRDAETTDDRRARGEMEEKRINSSIVKKSPETEAATKIQASFRGYQVRKQLKSKNGSNDIISTRRAVRRKSSGRLTDAKTSPQAKSKPSDPDRAAAKIQAGVRGFLVRKRVQKAKKPIAQAS